MVVNVVEEVDVWLGLSNPGLSNPIQESDRMFFCPGPLRRDALDRRPVQQGMAQVHRLVRAQIHHCPGNPVKQDKQISFQANSSVYTTCRVLPKL